MIFTPLPQAQWIIITVLVVMSAQSTLGGVLIKSQMRFWGTVAGAAFSVLTLLFFGIDPWVIGTVLFITILFFSYMAGSTGDVSAAGTLGAVTIAMMLLIPNPNIAVAGARFLEIIIGIVLAFLVSRFIFPIHAHALLLRGFADTLLDLRRHFDLCWTNRSAEWTLTDVELDEKITKAFPIMRKLLHESKFELGKNHPDLAKYQNVFNSLIKIYRAINMLYYSEHSSREAIVVIEELKGLDHFKQQASALILQLSEAITSKKVKEVDFLIADWAHYMETEFKPMVQQKEYSHIAAVNAFLFAVKLLTVELRKLAETMGEMT